MVSYRAFLTSVSIGNCLFNLHIYVINPAMVLSLTLLIKAVSIKLLTEDNKQKHCTADWVQYEDFAHDAVSPY